MAEIFSVDRFERFCAQLKIDSKEYGPMPLKWLGGQRYFVNEVAAGINNDVHTFVVLKGRQLGISTVSLALDLYWLFKHRGLQGAVVTDTDENREVFRSYVEQYVNSLPKSAKPPTEIHNRVQLVLQNNSRLMYMVAGVRKKGELGRAKAVNFMHGTECSSWADEEGFLSLMNTLAQVNPHRLYIFESTARGYNMFYDVWETAKKSKTQRAIFIGWWRNEIYRKPKGSTDFKTYWDGHPTSDERIWIKEIYERYRVNIEPEQLAWWRWYVDEKMNGESSMALQEMPPTEDYAFQLSGSKYFSSERVNRTHQRAIKQECVHFRYIFGLNFEDTQFVQCNEEQAEVTVWEVPQTNGVYAMGCDPAYGSSEWADAFAAQIGRCYADRIEQVCEVCATDWTEQQYAWAVVHLAGWYRGERGCMLTLEMQGPGGAVLNEINNLKRMSGFLPRGDPRAGAFDVVGMIRDYLWTRQDSMTGNVAMQWQTNPKEKVRMMSTLRSYFEREMVIINSPQTIQQFRNIHRTGDQIGGEGRAKDDQVIALAILVIAWNDWLMQEMQAANRTYERENRPQETQRALSPVEAGVLKFLQKQGIQYGPRR